MLAIWRRKKRIFSGGFGAEAIASLIAPASHREFTVELGQNCE
jgi:hypothetical protein